MSSFSKSFGGGKIEGSNQVMNNDEFFSAALNNSDSDISHGNFDRNVTIDEAKGLLENPDKGLVIGPPIGLREYISLLNTMLLARNPISLDAEASAEIERRNREWEATMSSTEDEVQARHVGVYYRKGFGPHIRNAIGSLEDATEDLEEEIEKEIEFIYAQASYADPELLLMRLQQLKRLLLQVEMTGPEHAPRPRTPDFGMGGPSM